MSASENDTIVSLRAEVAALRSDRDAALAREATLSDRLGASDPAAITTENTRLSTELRESVEQQTAMAEVLQVINASPGDLTRVFDTMLEKAMRLCGSAFGILRSFDGEYVRSIATRGVPEALSAFSANTALIPRPGSTMERVLQTREPGQDLDIRDDEGYASGESDGMIAIADLGGARTVLHVPLVKDPASVGLFTFYRQEVRAFSGKQIALLENFADQAVIAMENARLLTEQREALEQQTATADILRAINTNPGNLAPVFDLILEKAHTLCGAEIGSLGAFDGTRFHKLAWRGYGQEMEPTLREPYRPQHAHVPLFRGETMHVPNVLEHDFGPDSQAAIATYTANGLRTWLEVPLWSNGLLLGTISGWRREMTPFQTREIVLLESFAAQAVIAMENARLLTEQREALEQQTATAEVLGVINANPGDLVPVFDAILEKGLRLAEAAFGTLWTYDGDRMHVAASQGMTAALAEYRAANKAQPPTPQTLNVIANRRTDQQLDLRLGDGYRSGHPGARAVAELGGARTVILVPLVQDESVLGFIQIYRQEVRAFTDKQIALLESFAAQAAIAMQNARLLEDLKQRTGDLQESLEYQTATSDVLKVISRSTFDLEPVLDTIIETATQLCDADFANIHIREDDVFRHAASNARSGFDAAARGGIMVPGRGTAASRAAMEGRPIQIEDVTTVPDYGSAIAIALGGVRTALGVPMLRDGIVIGVLSFGRRRAELFTDRQIALIGTFADQAIIAMENTRLITEQREALEQQTATADILRAINTNPGNLPPVFDAVLEKALRLCGASIGGIYVYTGAEFVPSAFRGITPEFAAFDPRQPLTLYPGGILDTLLKTGCPIQDPDLMDTERYRNNNPYTRALVDLGGIRALLDVPLLNDGNVVGIITIFRAEPGEFPAKQIALLENFAAQAVIAMENARLLDEQREALERQTAMAEVLRIINASPGSLAPVFAAILEAVLRLSGSAFGSVWTYDGELMHAAATRGYVNTQPPFRPSPGGNALRALHDDDGIVQVPDIRDTDLYRSGNPTTVRFGDSDGVRTHLLAGLRKDGKPLGNIFIFRTELKPFTEEQIALVKAFADQAVIAIENTRLIIEQREALEQQTATAEVLQVINASPGDLAPVFDTMLEKAMRLCGAAFGVLWRWNGERLDVTAARGVPEAFATFIAENVIDPPPDSPLGQTLLSGQTHQVLDAKDSGVYDSGWTPARAIVDLGGAHTILSVPLFKDNVSSGLLTIYRQNVRAFSGKEIALVESFASQAVIAMENARLLNEQREALERQTAMAEVLRIINASPGQIAPVFDAILEAVLRLSDAVYGALYIFDGDLLHRQAVRGYDDEEMPFRSEPRMMSYPLIHENVDIASYPDLRESDAYRSGASLSVRFADDYGARSGLLAALRKDGKPVGQLVMFRKEVKPFTDAQIALVKAFAAQAVIAMENARLINEQREALERQTAMSEVLRIINASPGSLVPVFDAILEAVLRLSDSAFGSVWTYDGEMLHPAATRGYVNTQPSFRPSPGGLAMRSLRDESGIVLVPDARETDEYRSGNPTAVGFTDEEGVRTHLLAGLRTDGKPLGNIFIFRTELKPFTDEQIALVKAFAAQAVIAIENARLLGELRERTDELAERNSEYSERIEQQAATIDVLNEMSSSPGDARPVLDAIARRANAFCEADGVGVVMLGDGLLHLRVHSGFSQAATEAYEAAFPRPVDNSTVAGRSMLVRDAVHVPDFMADPEYVLKSIGAVSTLRSSAAVPLLRDGVPIGAIGLARSVPGAYSDAQMQLLKTFAEQAVIAITSAETYRALQIRTADLQESLEYQTATSDVLKVISRSTFDLQPVLDAVVETAVRLCDADQGVIFRREGHFGRLVSNYGFPPEYEAVQRARGLFDSRVPPASISTAGAAMREARIVHIPDVAAVPGYADAPVRLGKQRTGLGVPLMRNGETIGAFALARQRVEPFTERQIEVVSTFADQAAIAIENARLLGELRERTEALTQRNSEFGERIEHQAATIDVLKEMSSSPGDAQRALDLIARHAWELCDANGVGLYSFDGNLIHLLATHAHSEIQAFQSRFPMAATRDTTIGRAILDGRIDHLRGLEGEPEISQNTALSGARSFLHVPLFRNDTVIGAIGINALKPGGFTDSQVELLKTFAEQAVIAISSAETYRALQERTAALALRNSEFGERIEQQAATIDVLKTMSRSLDDTQPVFDQIVQRARNLCNGDGAALYEFDGKLVHYRAQSIPDELYDAEALQAYRSSFPMVPSRGSISCRAILEKRIIHIRDTSRDPELSPEVRTVLAGVASHLTVPLSRDDQAIGAITLTTREVGGFSDSQVAPLQTFAEQAVIAIGSVANYRALRERTAELAQRQEELRITFENMGDGVAMFDDTRRLVAWNRKFQDILDVPDALMEERLTVEDYIHYLTSRGEFGAGADPAAQLDRMRSFGAQPSSFERTRPNGRIIEVRVNPVQGGGFVLIYADITERKRAEAEIAAARDAAEEAARTIEAAYRELKIAQANLIQAEKMASLGQLTAGIAHEIKNPLNFVNNFAALSVDLLSELKETAAPGFATLSDEQRAEIDDVSAMLTSNLEKITEHGKRADSIVKSMLEHSRGSSAERRVVDLNALVDEALNLAYHGARAHDQSFNITLERDFADGIAPIEVNPQDLTRMFLNLFSNGFYAANQRARGGTDGGFAPALKVSTRNVGEAVVIRVRDNGIGIPADIREKLFQPFFTTKPTGEGTGLGLSITYDIVSKQHGGTIDVESAVGDHTEFTVTLPRHMLVAEASGA